MNKKQKGVPVGIYSTPCLRIPHSLPLFVLQFVTHDSNVTHNNICEKYSSWTEKRIFVSNQYTGGLMWNVRLNLCFSLKERLLIPLRPNAGWPYSQTSYSRYLCPAHVGLITVSLELYVALITSSNYHCCQLGGAGQKVCRLRLKRSIEHCLVVIPQNKQENKTPFFPGQR